MIAAAAGLLVVALVLLLVGIAKSSVAPLVLSVVATLGACALLSASWAYYRRAVAGDEAADVAPWSRPGNGYRQAGAVPPNWDALDEDAAAALARTFGFDELQAVRGHEVTHGYRKAVLDAIDGRIDEIVTTRRSVS